MRHANHPAIFIVFWVLTLCMVDVWWSGGLTEVQTPRPRPAAKALVAQRSKYGIPTSKGYHSESATNATLVKQSVCWSIPRFVSFEPTPMRSPLLIADALLPYIKGTRYCQIGTRTGDGLVCLKHHPEGPKSILAVEMVTSYCETLRQRQIDVICDNFLRLSPNKLFSCDVIFWWIGAGINDCLLKLLNTQLPPKRRPHVTVLVAFDLQYREDRDGLYSSVHKFGGQVLTTVNFIEGSDKRQRGNFSLVKYKLGFKDPNPRRRSCEAFKNGPTTVQEDLAYVRRLVDSSFFNHSLPQYYM